MGNTFKYQCTSCNNYFHRWQLEAIRPGLPISPGTYLKCYPCLQSQRKEYCHRKENPDSGPIFE